MASTSMTNFLLGQHLKTSAFCSRYFIRLVSLASSMLFKPCFIRFCRASSYKGTLFFVLVQSFVFQDGSLKSGVAVYEFALSVYD